MASKFECEIRIYIDNINEFENKLNDLEAKIILEYNFSDTYYKQKSNDWNPLNKTMRLREWHNPNRGNFVYYSVTEFIENNGITFKRSKLKEGKKVLCKGDLAKAKEFLQKNNFEPWLKVTKKDCKIWKSDKLPSAIIVEYINELSWTAEIEVEGEDINQASNNIKEILQKLKENNFSSKPVSVLVSEAKP